MNRIVIIVVLAFLGCGPEKSKESFRYDLLSVDDTISYEANKDIIARNREYLKKAMLNPEEYGVDKDDIAELKEKLREQENRNEGSWFLIEKRIP